MTAAEKEKVVLLHGLWRTRRSLRRLSAALAAHGYEVETWTYPSHGLAAAELVRRVHERMKTLRGKAKVHFVGHSLGAVLIRGALLMPVEFGLGRVVMLAPPNQGAGIVGRLRSLRWMRWMVHGLGRTVGDLAPGSAFLGSLGVPTAEIGIIAGTRPHHPINPSAWANRWFGVEESHDGTVELRSTPLPGMRDFIALPAHHTWICDDREVIRQTAYFLRHGHFDHGRSGG
jgi:triacylglycerol lipase